jgi:hypothetical protein
MVDDGAKEAVYFFEVAAGEQAAADLQAVHAEKDLDERELMLDGLGIASGDGMQQRCGAREVVNRANATALRAALLEEARQKGRNQDQTSQRRGATE